MNDSIGTTALDRLIAGEIDWQEFIEQDDCERLRSGRPPVPELTPGQELRMWLRIADRAEALAPHGGTGTPR